MYQLRLADSDLENIEDIGPAHVDTIREAKIMAVGIIRKRHSMRTVTLHCYMTGLYVVMVGNTYVGFLRITKV